MEDGFMEDGSLKNKGAVEGHDVKSMAPPASRPGRFAGNAGLSHEILTFENSFADGSSWQEGRPSWREGRPSYREGGQQKSRLHSERESGRKKESFMDLLPSDEEDEEEIGGGDDGGGGDDDVGSELSVGRYTLNPVDPQLARHGFNPCAYEAETRFQSLLSNSTCTAATARASGNAAVRPRARWGSAG